MFTASKSDRGRYGIVPCHTPRNQTNYFAGVTRNPHKMPMSLFHSPVNHPFKDQPDDADYVR